MRKIILLTILLSISSFALTLDQVRADINKNTNSGDSTEIKIQTTVNTIAGRQVVSVYIVRKGPNKIYSEIKSPLINQRSVVNGNRMKVIDLNTQKFQIQAYNGEVLESLAYTKFNPLDTGNWKQPKFVSNNVYAIEGDNATLYYNAKKKRIEKMVSEDSQKSVLSTYSYDGEGRFKAMNTSVIAKGIETKVSTEVLMLRSSKDFPDRLFEF